MADVNVCAGCGHEAIRCIPMSYQKDHQDVPLCIDCLIGMAEEKGFRFERPIKNEMQALRNGFMPIDYFEEMTEQHRIELYGDKWRLGFDKVDMDWLDAQERVK